MSGDELAGEAPGGDLGAMHRAKGRGTARVRHTPRRAARRRPLRCPDAGRTLRRRAGRRPSRRPRRGRDRRGRGAQRRPRRARSRTSGSAVRIRRARTTGTWPGSRRCSPGCPDSVGGVTVNRLCASGLSAVVGACHAVMAGDGDLFVAGGVESMTRAPLVTAKPAKPFERGDRTLHDTTLGWRFVNPAYADRFSTEVDGRDGRERGRAVGRRARGPGRVRAPLAAALGRCRRRRPVRRRAGAGGGRRARRASPPGDAQPRSWPR